MAYIGQTLTEGTRRAYTYTATASQTTFNAVYGVGAVDVYQNGILLQPADYTATTGTTVVLGVGAAVNDEITIIAHNTFSVADTVSASQGGTFASAVTASNGLTVDDDGATPLTVDRATNDGTVIDVQKDGTTVGSIGTSGGDIYVGSTASLHAGITFAERAALPNINGVTANDGGTDLGATSNRWRDLYLSGGAYIGGTVAANKLNSYEEGTFTASFGGATIAPLYSTGIYTKIGNMVYWKYYSGASTISSPSGIATFGGLPYNVANQAANYVGITIAHNTFFGSTVGVGQQAYYNINTTSLYFNNMNTINNPTYVSGTGYLMIGGFYKVA